MTPDQISRQALTGAKRPLPATKRLRSNIPRRKRAHLLPIVAGVHKSSVNSDLLKDSSSCLRSEVSVDSTLRSRRSNDFRRITRAYAKKISIENQVSEVSEVTGGSVAKNSNHNVTTSELSCAESMAEAKSSEVGDSKQICRDASVPKEAEYNLDLDAVLACSEKLSEEYSSNNEMALSEFESEIFYNPGNYSSDYSVSVAVDSTDEDFSEKSREKSAPSAAFSLFLQLGKVFVKLNCEFSPKSILDEPSDEFAVVKFEDEEDEESYRHIRTREKKDVMLRDFGENYCCATEFGDLILEQRQLMVDWMVEHGKATQLHYETLFLGVSLMDRFLSKGYFETERNLQLLGIAALTLATRLEEVQPGNSIRHRSFTVGSNVYTRCEVVAMEWLILDVIDFQCMIPTTHNFLWFYLKAAKADAEVESLSRSLAVLSLMDHERLSFWPSTVAAGLVILACLAAKKEDSCLRVMETHVRTRTDDLPECIQSLDWLVKHAC